ncbi:MAG: uroporphyrinogen decarboxylase [Clostridiales Family XIII bacterium]|jgi:hypothetical protein|nr:uroporphyrinogen decarboxylase [Clostridiales Family XIII bacterium]
MSEEKMKLRGDLLAGRVPKRVFMQLTFTPEAACGLAGVDLVKAHFDPAVKQKAYRSVCETFYSDAYPIENVRWPEVYAPLGARNWVMSSTGAMQHPEVTSLYEEDFDEYIDDAFGTIVKKVLPRLYPKLDPANPGAGLSLAKAYQRYQQTAGEEVGFQMQASEEFDYAPGFFVGLFCEAPFDFLSDQLRGFKNITIDVRRNPGKVEKAVNASLPLMRRQAIPRNPAPGATVFMPLHLAPYLRPADFERFYWPTFNALVQEIHEAGMSSFLFAEQDWTRYSDYLASFPENQIIKFEDGDVKKIKEVVGKKQIIGGFFDPTHTLTRSKEDCIDEAKRLLEIGMPGGRFYFAFGRHVIDIHSIDIGKLAAVIDYVHENAVY